MDPMVRKVVRIGIPLGDSYAMGPGKADLLEAIQATGSISAAGRKLGMSYRRAWLLVDSLKHAFREPPTVACTGGKGGGGVQLTQFGETLIDSYRSLEREIEKLAQRHLQAVIPAVVRHTGVAAKPSRRPIAHKRAER